MRFHKLTGFGKLGVSPIDRIWERAQCMFYEPNASNVCSMNQMHLMYVL